MTTIGKPDGSSNTTEGAFAPVKRTRSVAREIALCDLKQAQQINAWAASLEAALHGSLPAHDVMQVVNEMRNTAFVVERFTEDLLDKLGAEK